MKRKVILVGLTAKDTNLFHIIHIFVKMKLLNKMWSLGVVKGIAYNIQCIVCIEHCICVCRMNTEYKIKYSVQCNALLFSVLPLLCTVIHCSGLHYLSNVLLFTVLHFTTSLMHCYALYWTVHHFNSFLVHRRLLARSNNSYRNIERTAD